MSRGSKKALRGKRYKERYEDPKNSPTLENGDGSRSTHSMSAEVDEFGNWFAFPTVVERSDGSMHRFENNQKAMDDALTKGNYTKFDNKEEAINYASGGYKSKEFKEHYKSQPRPEDNRTEDEKSEDKKRRKKKHKKKEGPAVEKEVLLGALSRQRLS
jgi:hypothetical protein